ncbi:Mitotic spindle checkpoint component mad2 [Naganishia albida]|nr:Mitotic spindle checkpoint component mad2 [Naganishia albida]
MTTQQTRQSISLKGSTKIVTEFFEYSVNSILYQRNVYPADDFRMVKKYGLPMLITSDESLKAYLDTILKQVHAWLMSNTINRLVLAITSKETLETLERWQFDIIREDDDSAAVSSSIVPQGSTINGLKPGGKPKEKTEKEVQGEIREIMKQITASVTFLPTLEEECSFTLLAYTSTSDPLPLPEKWNDADPHLIEKGKVEQVRLRSFSTNVHKMEAMVAYKIDE